jgi:hypothetical protein
MEGVGEEVAWRLAREGEREKEVIRRWLFKREQSVQIDCQ